MRKISKERLLFYVLVGLVLIMSVLSPTRFFTLDNFQSMASQLPELAILSLGMMVVIITGGIDLSITFTAALAGIAAAFVLSSGQEQALPVIFLIAKAMFAALLTGLACGLLNGFLVAYVGVSPILVTLGTMTLFEGIGLWLTKGGAISGFPIQYQSIGSGSVLFIPVPMLIFVLLALITALLLEYTAWGRSVYMFGCNPIATYFSGINTKKLIMLVYLYAATMAAMSAIIMISRYNSAKIDYGSSYLLQSVATVVLGGTDIAGGYGKVIGTVLAATIVQVLSSGLNILGINRFIVDIILGTLLISVLLVNFFLTQQKGQRRVGEKERSKGLSVSSKS